MITCSRCLLVGHTDENCWITSPAEGEKPVKSCGYCVQPGHIGRDCPELTGSIGRRLELRKKREEKFDKILDSLEMMWMLVMNEVPPKTFENGVGDSTGMIDEGMVRANNILNDAERLLREHSRLGYVGRGPV